jgi:hypothetical protein
MASRFPRRRRDRPEPEPDGPDEQAVHLDDDQHAWWAQRDIEGAWTPPASRGATPDPPDAPPRDILAEHFGDDWRTSFGFDAAPGSSPAAPQPEEATEDLGGADELDAVDGSDPYAVLQIEPSASWDEIVDAHRRMARRHHPDRLVGRPAAEIAAGEDRIRTINVAYQELRVRRGR